MTNRIRELFEQEARDLDPRWNRIVARALSAAGDGYLNPESVDASRWPVGETRPWSAVAGIWMAEVNKALNDPNVIVDQLYFALGQRFDVVARRQSLLVEKGLGQNKVDLLGAAVEGFTAGAGEGGTNLLTLAKLLLGVAAVYFLVRILAEARVAVGKG